ncbi:hypothetical protein [Spiroplasma endosymbiont of Danaus chrysippus]|nr:hypothetical protein [Spiroplasma endosymbiont of Danaus chrysippus]
MSISIVTTFCAVLSNLLVKWPMPAPISIMPSSSLKLLVLTILSIILLLIKKFCPNFLNACKSYFFNIFFGFSIIILQFTFLVNYILVIIKQIISQLIIYAKFTTSKSTCGNINIYQLNK